LPTVLVPAALFGHIVVGRRLLAERRDAAALAHSAQELVAR
jgi:hypothetical protein